MSTGVLSTDGGRGVIGYRLDHLVRITVELMVVLMVVTSYRFGTLASGVQ